MDTIRIETHDGHIDCVPCLVKLPGVGRKTANVVMLEAFSDPQGIAVDTHCMRIANRMGLSREIVPEKIEKDLLKIVTPTSDTILNLIKYINKNYTSVDGYLKSCKLENTVLNQIKEKYSEDNI